MHFHLPRPLHGWREFFGEVGIIVLGVLIALGAEQMMETVHQRREAQAAERTIRSELELNMAKLRDRSQEKACVGERLAELQTLIASADRRDGTIATPSWVGRPQFWTMQLSRWEASSQAGHAALVPPEELALYGAMYSYMANVNTEMIAEQADWARLRSLEQLHKLTPEMTFQLTNTLQDARYLNWRIDVWTTQLQRQFSRLHLKVVPNDIGGSSSACIAMNTPRDKAVRESKSPYGEP